MTLERRAELACALIANRLRNFLDRHSGRADQFSCVLEALLDQEAVNGCAIGAVEAFFQEGRGNGKLLAENLDGEFFG